MKHNYKLAQLIQLKAATEGVKRKIYLILAMALPMFIMSACMDDDFEGEPRDVCPAVESQTPEPLEDRVAINTTITVTFNKEMKPESINENTFIVSDPAGPLPGSVNYSNKVATFTPANFLPETTVIDVEITTEVYDLYDFTIQEPYLWTFSTGTLDEISAPYVVATIPEDEEEDVPVNTFVAAIFNEELDPATIDPGSLKLTNLSNGQQVAGAVAYSDMVLFFTPDQNLDYFEDYEATVVAGIKDMHGNRVVLDFSWQFKTMREDIPLTVNIGEISEYAILSGAYINNLEPGTTIAGDVGIYPGTKADITGLDLDTDILPPYTYYATEPDPLPILPVKLIRDKLILKQAYNNAKEADYPLPQFLSGDQGGNTLAPGIYSANTLSIMTGDMILDADGDPNAFWIFQVETLLETGGDIILAGGADPNRIFWQVGIRDILGPNVLIGEDTHFIGTVLSKQGISVKSGATVTGRLMVKDGGVRLRNATIALP